MSKKTTDIVAYIGLIGWAIAYFATANREESKFHLNQGLVFAIAQVVVNVIARILPKLSLVFNLVNIALFVLWLIALIAACKGEEKPAPVLGGIQILK